MIMRWQNRRRSSNVEVRGGARKKTLGGGILGIVVGLFLWLVMGVNPMTAFQTGSQIAGSTQTQQTRQPTAEYQQEIAFLETVLASTEDVWQDIFAQSQQRYKKPNLVVFTGRVNSACGMASAVTGPFYCPADQKLYLDTQFFYEMRQKMGITGDLQAGQRTAKAGDFAQAYVVAHEVGHHVQTLLGISSQVHKARIRMTKTKGNVLSVKQELQADCFAGIWANHSNKRNRWLEQGDIEEALHAASQIGDDVIQSKQTGYVRPESFTHGSSAQRVKWFKRGFMSGDINSCDTFG